MTYDPFIVLVPYDPALAQAAPGLRITSIDELPEISGPAVIFIDWLLDEGSGLELCRRLRSDPSNADAHIVIVLDDHDRELRRRALHAGADDYVIGPLTPDLLTKGFSGTGLICSDTTSRRAGALAAIELDQRSFQIRAMGKLVTMAPNEFRLLAYLLENTDRLLTRHELIEALRNREDAVDERTVDVWIGRIRRALMAVGVKSPIRTVRSLGYVYDS